jgi:hypothetical protein
MKRPGRTTAVQGCQGTTPVRPAPSLRRLDPVSAMLATWATSRALSAGQNGDGSDERARAGSCGRAGRYCLHRHNTARPRPRRRGAPPARRGLLRALCPGRRLSTLGAGKGFFCARGRMSNCGSMQSIPSSVQKFLLRRLMKGRGVFAALQDERQAGKVRHPPAAVASAVLLGLLCNRRTLREVEPLSAALRGPWCRLVPKRISDTAPECTRGGRPGVARQSVHGAWAITADSVGRGQVFWRLTACPL